MRFLEREAQMAALAGYAGEAEHGVGRLVLVEGEAGVGKSTLLERLEVHLDRARWCWGACDGLSTPRPLAPLRDIAAEMGGERGGELLAACRRDAPREELFALVLEALRGGERLTVLVFEDVHWADDVTLDLVRFLGRRVQRLPVLVLVTFREEGRGTPDGLRVALGDLSRQRATRRVTLPPLTLAAVEFAVEGTGLDPAYVHRLTGGNPYFVAELLASPGDSLPASARDSVLARVATLDDTARHLVEVAALAGARVDTTLVGDLAEAPLAAWDELVDAGLLLADGRTTRFRHEIARLAIADSVAPHRAAHLHGLLLAALTAAGERDDARLAFHAEEAGDAAAVLRHATAAAERARRLAAHREAIEHYRRALRFADHAPPHARAALHDELAAELAITDLWEAAGEHLVLARDLWHGTGDRVREGDTLRRWSQCLWRLSRGEESEAASRLALDVLEPAGPTPELARAVAQRAGRFMVLDRAREAIEVAERAVAMAEDLDLPDVLSDALDTMACSMAGLGLAWEPTMRRALDVALEGRCPEQAARAYVNYYGQLVDQLRATEGERLYLDGHAFCEEHDVATFGNCLAASRVEALEAAGDWDGARALAAQRLAGTSMSPINALHFQLGLARIDVRRGVRDAGPFVDSVVESALRTGEPQWTVPLLLVRAERHWLDGRLADASRDVRAALAHGGSPRLVGTAAVWAARLRLDGPRDAVPEPWASTLRGDARGAARRWDEAGNPYETALALLDVGEADAVTEAFARFDRLGAAPAARVARQLLREAGVRALPHGVRASTREHPAGLTAREHEVLELVCAGATNDEIARTLVISVKTAGHHVSAVLAKLGVSSRRSAAAEARLRGLVPDGEVAEAT